MPFNPNITGGGQDLRPNTFSDVGGSTLNQQTISAYDYYTPQEYTQLLYRHLGQLGVRVMLDMLGNKRGVKAPTTGHYEAPWRGNLVTVGAVAGGGAGANVTITLDAADMFNAGVTVNGVSRQSSYPIVGEVLQFNNGTLGYISAKNTTVTPHQLTVRPLNSAVNLLPNITVGAAYAVSGNMHGEGTGLPAGRTPRVVKYSNTFQIIKTKAGCTGSELTNAQYFEVVKNQGQNLFMLAKRDAYEAHELAIDNVLLFGQQANNLVVFNPNLGHDVSISGTEGLIPFIQNGGLTDTYTVGAYTMTDFDDLSRYYETERVSGSNLVAWQGYELNIEIENVFGSILNGDVAALLTKSMGFSDYLPNDNTDRDGDHAMNFGFRGVKKGGFNYLFTKCAAFNSRTGAGAPAYNYNRWQIIFPQGKTPDVQDGDQYGIIGYEWKELDGNSRKMKVGSYHGLGIDGPISNDIDVLTVGMLSEIAFHGTRANACAIQRPV
jgi:hypothetical protein